MSYNNNNKTKRVLSALLSILMIFTIIPASVTNVFALPNETTYNFIVKDTDDNPIKDVTFSFDVDGVAPVQSDEEGKASVALPEGTECTYNVNKIGYKELIDMVINSETATDIELQLEVIPKVTVTGTVCNEEGEPLENVAIGITGYCEYNTMTNADGEFSITNVYEGQKYTISAELDGYKRASQLLVLDSSNEVVLFKKTAIADFSFTESTKTVYYATNASVVAKSSLYPDAVVKYSSSDISVLTVDENTGAITCVSVGNAIITATVSATDDYLETKASISVNVEKGEQPEVNWSNSVPDNFTWKDKFINTLTGGIGGTVAYSSSDETIAKVDNATGEVIFLKPGSVTITGTMNGGDYYKNASSTYTIEVGKADQTALEFEQKNPDAIFYGDTLENAAAGGSTSNIITYKSSDIAVATVDADGKITTHKSGTVTITATMAGDELYNEVSASYDIQIYRAEQKAEFLFVKGDTDKEIAYGEEFENAANGGENSPITYKSSDDSIASVDGNGKITTHKAGEVIITAVNPADDRFNKKEISYKLTVVTAEQTVDFEKTEIPLLTYGSDEANEFSNVATAKTDVTYSSSDETVVKVDKNTGKLEVLKAGTVTITATAEETEQYKEAVSSYTLTIGKADQTISFIKGTTPVTTFNLNGNKYSNTASSSAIVAGESDIECVYSIASGSEFVDGEINKTTGEFRIKGAGTIVVNVAFDSNDRYNLAMSSYTLTVEKANQTISFPKASYETKSEMFFNANPPKAEESGEYGTGTITYSVKADPDTVVDSIDTSTGKIAFTGNAGTAIILATKAEDDNYNIAVAEYKITYKLISVQNPADYYTLSGDEIDSNSGWFTGNVSIVAKDGYQLSYEKNRWNANWQTELSDAVTDDGVKQVSFYAKNINDGSITSKITVTIKKDAKSPAANLKVEEISVWDKLLTFIKEGKTNKDKVFYEAIANDDTSGVKDISYYVDYNSTDVMSKAQLDTIDEALWTKAKTITENNKCVVYAKVIDNAGHYVYATTNGIVFDASKPQALISLSETEKGTNYYTKDIDVSITVTDAAPSSGIDSVTYKTYSDGVEVYNKTTKFTNSENPEYNELSNTEIINFTLEAEKHNSDNVKIEVIVTDNAGNEFVTEKLVKISTEHPEISVRYEDVYEQGMGTDGVVHYNPTREAYVTIKCRTSLFDGTVAKNSIKVVAKDAVGNDVTGIYTVDNWVTIEGDTPDDATHTAKLTFKGDARYSFTSDYTDIALLSAEQYKSGEFVVDTDAPTGTVSVEANVWSVLLEKLTFGLWSKDSVQIIVSADDATGEIKRIEYYKSNSDSIITKSDLEALEAGEWVEYSQLEVSQDEQFNVYFKITDYANNIAYICTDGYIVDKTASQIELIPEKANENKIYNGDVEVIVSVKDKTDNNDYYSGIQKVEYWVEADGVETQREVLYSFDYIRDTGDNTNGGTLTIKEKDKDDIVKTNAVPAKSDLKHDFSKAIVVDSEKNNSSDVKMYVSVTDNAGNVSTDEIALDIDITAPVIDISYDNNQAYKVEDDHGFFPAERTATVVITERTNHFDAEAATEGIKITATDAEGNVVIEDCKSLITDWDTQEGDTPDSATHTAKISYTSDAKYTFEIEYTDRADNKCSSLNTGDCVTPWSFTVDKTSPTGTVSVGELGTWDELITFLTFGLWSKDTVEISKTSFDETSGIESVSYYKTKETKAIKAEQLASLDNSCWNVFDNAFDVPANEQFTVYVRIVDNSGNVTYISTNGIIVDNVKPEFIPALEDTKPEITLAPVEDAINGIYKSDVTVAVKVIDPIISDSYSGIKEIKYEITNMGEKTQEDVLYSFGDKMPTKDKLVQHWEDKSAIVVNSKLNNSNNVVVKVYAVDNAGNEKIDTLPLKLDVTAPQIDVSYDKNDGDTSFKESTYFNKTRVATIVVTERNFNPKDVEVNISNTDDVIPVISGWKTVRGGANGDKTTHTAKIVYKSDGDYTFDISCTDIAGNTNKPVNYGDSLAPQKFTIDKTHPTFTVTYDNNEALNGNYYKAQRVATIVLNEHNFETSRVDIQLSATDNGVKAERPTVSKWKSKGDVHTATITYAADSHYTFDFDYKDKAGNKTADIAQQEFYVDLKNPAVSITGISDQSANNAETIGFVISATDTNFDTFTPEITVTDINGNRLNANIGAINTIANGTSYVVKNIEADGIYRISCKVVDKAGNAFNQVTLQRENGSTYVENRSGNDTLLTFSVNRDGSTYEVNKSTSQLVKNYYVQSILDDIVIVEVNVDELREFNVTLNNKELVRGTDFNVTESGGNGAWRKYTYTINKDLFKNEGEYKLVVSSKDAANNDAFSDVKDTEINFVVDKTKPVVTVSGLAEGKDYQVESQKVTIIPTDDGGALKSLVVRLVDKNGNTIKELVNLADDALMKTLEKGDGKITFEIAEGVDQNVEIICNDKSVDADGKTNTYKYTIKDIDISPSALKLFWADPFLRWGSIGGVTLLVGLLVFIIIKRKKNTNK